MSCYNIIKHKCSCACQGCSDCPLADKPDSEVSRWTMLKYLIVSKYESWSFDIWCKFHKKELDEIFKGFLDVK